MEHQRTGSQGITNFAVATGESSRGAGGAHDFALKIFSMPAGFERIRAIHALPELAPCMPFMHSIVTSEEVVEQTPEAASATLMAAMHLCSLTVRFCQ